MRFLASATLLAALVGVAPALANTLPVRLPGMSFTPSIHVPVSSVESQAQLVKQLQGAGYSDVELSDSLPNIATPQPQLTNPTTDLVNTPVHKGWNGTAYKNGKLYNIYVDA